MSGRKLTVSVQMYTLRDHSAKDFLGTFTQVAKIGYGAVELAGTNNLPALELKKHLDSLGLAVSGAHVGIQELEGDNFQKTVDYYRALNVKYIICPWWPAERRKTQAEWLESSRQLNEIGAKLRALGMQMCYHNHDFEFQQVDGKYGWDLLFQNAEPQNLGAELDCYWVSKAGIDPVRIIRQYKGRIPLLHAKDMAAGPEKHFASVGAGILNWPAIIQAARESGTLWYVVEQDDCYGQDSFESVKISLQNLKKMGVE